MKSRSLLLSFLFSFFTILSFSQTSQHVCGSYDGYLQDEQKKHPEFYKSLDEKNNQLDNQNIQLLKKVNSNTKNTGKKIIPVVVHVIHNMGSENVTDAQINDALTILNNNVNGQDADPFYEFLKNERPGIMGTKNIKWNFSKFLVNKNGEVIKRYGPTTKPEAIESDIVRLL